MKSSTFKKHLKISTLCLSVGFSLAGCGGSSSSSSPAAMDDSDDGSDSSARAYSISVINLTANQPFSPVAFIAHKEGYHAWIDGTAASNELEQLAEGGDNTALVAQASSDSHYLSHYSGTAPIGPGAQENFQLAFDVSGSASVSLVTMLVNTNDAYTGINAKSIEALGVGDSITLLSPVWDAGTEANTEAAGTIPGPADGGEGFNESRSGDVGFVAFHPGVISQEDGLTSSTLNSTHRFDNPAARVVIVRTQ